MSLVDQNRKFYRFERKEGWEFVTHATSKIYDEEGNKIGNLQGKGTFRKQISLIDNDDNSLLTVKKPFFDKHDYIVFDDTKSILGFVRNNKKAEYSFEGDMIDKNENKILTGEGPFKEGKYGIGDKNKKIIAIFSFTEIKGWKNFFSGIERCDLEIYDTKFNRLVLLGFFISMLSGFYDVSPKGGEG